MRDLTKEGARAPALRAVGLLARLTGCLYGAPADSSDNGANLAQVALFQTEMPSLLAATIVAGGDPPLSYFAPLASGCGYDTTTQAFTCNAVVVNGLVTTLSYQLLATNGSPLAAMDASTTDGVHLQGTVAGQLLGGVGTSTTQYIDFRVTGYLGTTQVVSGISVTTFAFSALPSDTVSLTFTNVAVTPATNAYPVSGALMVDQPGGANHEVTTITFNGTATPSMVISNGGSVMHCTVDLTLKTPRTCTTVSASEAQRPGAAPRPRA